MLPRRLVGEGGRREEFGGREQRRRRTARDVVAEEAKGVAGDGKAKGYQGRANAAMKNIASVLLHAYLDMYGDMCLLCCIASVVMGMRMRMRMMPMMLKVFVLTGRQTHSHGPPPPPLAPSCCARSTWCEP